MSTVNQLAQPETEEATCATHGTYVSRRLFRSVWSKCPTCSAERQVRDGEEAERKDREDRRESWQRRIGEAGIPERFRDRSLQSYIADTPEQKKALEFAKTYADDFNDVLARGSSVLFVGRPGTGKTHLACGIGLRIMHRDGRSVLFCTVMRAIRRVKDTWSRGSAESETGAIAAMVFPDLLILDEVGVQFGSDTEKLILFDILNERYEKRRPTLLLSNLTTHEVQAFLGDRIFDRMREDGGEVVIFDWESHRGVCK